MIDQEWETLPMSARMRHRDPILDHPNHQVRVHWARVAVFAIGILFWVPILYWICA
jgi:hypothetical protein